MPHVYFVGNMQDYKEELMRQDNKFMKVISLPTFQRTHSIVLMDLATLQSYEVSFETSVAIKQINTYDPNQDNIFGVDKKQLQID